MSKMYRELCLNFNKNFGEEPVDFKHKYYFYKGYGFIYIYIYITMFFNEP